MRTGIIGYELAGKKTLFDILSENKKHYYKKGDMEIAQTTVHDERIATLSKIYNPHKTIYARLEFLLTPSITEDKKKNNKALSMLHSCDSIVIVARDFDIEGRDRNADMEVNKILDEIVFSDMSLAIGLLEKSKKLIKKQKTKQLENEIKLLEKLIDILENGNKIDPTSFNEEEKETIRKFDFLSPRPILVLYNIDEDDISKDIKRSIDIENINISLKIEKEISELEEKDRAEFLNELGIKVPGLIKMIQGIYRAMHLISFFTVGKDEVRAWTIKEGTIAKEAAGKIHSDIERGFIKAEVISYEDFIKAGDEKKAREQNLYRLEGKDYIVRDGDIINFRFNV